MVAAEGSASLSSWSGNAARDRRERLAAATQRRRDRTAAAGRLVAFVIATGFVFAAVVVVVLSVLLQRIAALGS